mmetsp:Transcript_3546/g.8838  ORF Transcript_3546/g.8838 Transcript_3546/m.8838 type:complete len:218 (+) Transcript_3546:649-1302(+)
MSEARPDSFSIALPSLPMDAGLETFPFLSGHRPPRTRKREDLPDPFGPVTSKLVPSSMLRKRSLMSTCPAGVSTVAPSNEMRHRLWSSRTFDEPSDSSKPPCCPSLPTPVRAFFPSFLRDPLRDLLFTGLLWYLLMLSFSWTMRLRKAPSLETLLGVLARRPSAPKSETTTPVWYRISESICARPFLLSTGRRCPSKNGPMMRTTATVAPKYFRAKS